MTNKTLHVIDMHCPNCVMRLEGIEDVLPGVINFQASYKTGKMLVEFDETRVDIEKIITAVKKAGYEAVLA